MIESINKRISIRKYTSEKPSKAILTEVLEAARQAPSAVNKQPWRFVVITNSEKLAAIQKSYDRDWFATAPAVIAVVGDHRQSWHRADGKDHCDVDIAIASEHIMLQATELGLGTCWVCNFDLNVANAVVGVAEGEEVCVLIPIGYIAPDAPLKEHQRKSFDEIVTFVE